MRQVPTGYRFETPRARMSAELGLAGDLWPGQHLLDDVGLEGRLAGDLAADAHARISAS